METEVKKFLDFGIFRLGLSFWIGVLFLFDIFQFNYSRRFIHFFGVTLRERKTRTTCLVSNDYRVLKFPTLFSYLISHSEKGEKLKTL